jgi:hypothetical protein
LARAINEKMERFCDAFAKAVTDDDGDEDDD